MKAKTILFLLLAIVCVSCESTFQINKSVIGNTYEDDNNLMWCEDGSLDYNAKITVSFTTDSIFFYQNDSLIEIQPYYFIKDDSIKYTSKINNEVKIEVYQEYITYEYSECIYKPESGSGFYMLMKML